MKEIIIKQTTEEKLAISWVKPVFTTISVWCLQQQQSECRVLSEGSRPMTAAEHRRLYWKRLRQDPQRLRLYNMRKARERKLREEKKRLSQK